MASSSTGVESSLFRHLYPKGYSPYRIKWFDLVLAFALFGVALFGYIRTLTPTVGAGDNGELTTTLYNMGSSHAPGYPLWGIVGKLFTFLPFGDIAYRVNLFTAVAAAGAVLFLFLILLKLLGQNRDSNRPTLSVHLPALAASFAFAFSQTLWGQAVGGEVYPLNAFLFSFMCFIMVLWYEEMIVYRSEGELHFAERTTILLFFAMGLSLTNHMLPMWTIAAFAIVLLPATILIVISERTDKFIEELKARSGALAVFAVLAVCCLAIGLWKAYMVRGQLPQANTPWILTAIFALPVFLTIYTIVVKSQKLAYNWVDKFFEVFNYGMWLLIFAMTIYLYLMIRANALAPLPDPKPLSWGDTVRLDILFSHMLRKQYGGIGGGDFNHLLGQIICVIKFNIEQFHWINFIIGLVGFVYFFLKDKIWGIFTLVAIVLFDIILISFVDFETDARMLSFQIVMYIQTFMFFAIYIAAGYQMIIDFLSKFFQGKKQKMVGRA